MSMVAEKEMSQIGKTKAARKLGSVGLVKSISDYIRLKKLGSDALNIGALDFEKLLERRRGSIKPVLMDQQVIAGVGNVYADELLFQARIHPKTPVESLARTTLRQIHRTMQSVLKKAVNCEADIERFPRSWLLPHRRRGRKCPRCDTTWEFMKVGGRTTCFCPRCQRRV